VEAVSDGVRGKNDVNNRPISVYCLVFSFLLYIMELVDYHGEKLTKEEIDEINAIQGKVLPVQKIMCSSEFPMRTIPYRKKITDRFVRKHYGQRKLLLAEIQVLTWYYKKKDNPIFVYAGAAPGLSLGIIAKLFPDLRMDLYDPNPFFVKESDKIKIFTGVPTGFFTDDTVKKYVGKKVIFISDIRTGKSDDEDEFSHEVDANMEQQRRWCEMFKAQGSLVGASLKFRLPYIKNDVKTYTEYMDGTVFTQVWAPLSSTECRLCIDGNFGYRRYDNMRHEQESFYRNTILREYGTFHHEIDMGLCKDIDHCLDCATEISFWRDYLVNQTQVRPSNYSKFIIKLMGYASMILKQKLFMPRQHPRYTKDIYERIKAGDKTAYLEAKDKLEPKKEGEKYRGVVLSTALNK